MKKLLIALTIGLFMSLGINAQTTKDSIPANNSISLQIGKHIDPVYGLDGKMIEGSAKVYFTVSDSSTVIIGKIVSEDELLRTRLQKQMEGMELDVRPEDVNQAMNIRIFFRQE